MPNTIVLGTMPLLHSHALLNHGRVKCQAFSLLVLRTGVWASGHSSLIVCMHMQKGVVRRSVPFIQIPEVNWSKSRFCWCFRWSLANGFGHPIWKIQKCSRKKLPDADGSCFNWMDPYWDLDPAWIMSDQSLNWIKNWRPDLGSGFKARSGDQRASKLICFLF